MPVACPVYRCDTDFLLAQAGTLAALVRPAEAHGGGLLVLANGDIATVNCDELEKGFSDTGQSIELQAWAQSLDEARTLAEAEIPSALYELAHARRRA
jgi:hypothetical protein